MLNYSSFYGAIQYEKLEPKISKCSILESSKYKISYFCKKNNTDHTYGYTPILIPFFRQKREWYTQKWGDVFIPIYLKIADLLSTCEEITFIGYGLPEADWTVSELLIGMANINPNVKINVVLLKPDNKLLGKYRKLFKDKDLNFYDYDAYDYLCTSENERQKLKFSLIKRLMMW